MRNLTRVLTRALKRGDLRSVRPLYLELRAAIEAAPTDDDTDHRHVTLLFNVIADLFVGRISPAAALRATTLPSTEVPPPSDLFCGDAVELDDNRSHVTATMLKWSVFLERLAATYAKSRFDPTDVERLWAHAQAGRLRTPEEDIVLTSRNGVVWFTSDEALQSGLSKAGGGHVEDSTAVYDALALDWSNKWDGYVPFPHARALVFQCVATTRFRSRVHVPTALDAWGHFLFVPNHRAPPYRWPVEAGKTVNPHDGSSACIEAIHGTLQVGAGTDFAAVPFGVVRKIGTGDRLDECGPGVIKRARERARSALREFIRQ